LCVSCVFVCVSGVCTCVRFLCGVCLFSVIVRVVCVW
jgi:hypothetical protein